MWKRRFTIMYTVEHWNFLFSGIIMECKLVFSWNKNSYGIILHIVHFFIMLDVQHIHDNIPQWYNNGSYIPYYIINYFYKVYLIVVFIHFATVFVNWAYQWYIICSSSNWVDYKQVDASHVTTTHWPHNPGYWRLHLSEGIYVWIGIDCCI